MMMPPVESGALPPKKRATPPSNGTPFWENVEHASSSNEGTAIRTDGNLNASLDLNHGTTMLPLQNEMKSEVPMDSSLVKNVPPIQMPCSASTSEGRRSCNHTNPLDTTLKSSDANDTILTFSQSQNTPLHLPASTTSSNQWEADPCSYPLSPPPSPSLSPLPKKRKTTQPLSPLEIESLVSQQLYFMKEQQEEEWNISQNWKLSRFAPLSCHPPMVKEEVSLSSSMVHTMDMEMVTTEMQKDDSMKMTQTETQKDDSVTPFQYSNQEMASWQDSFHPHETGVVEESNGMLETKHKRKKKKKKKKSRSSSKEVSSSTEKKKKKKKKKKKSKHKNLANVNPIPETYEDATLTGSILSVPTPTVVTQSTTVAETNVAAPLSNDVDSTQGNKNDSNLTGSVVSVPNTMTISTATAVNKSEEKGTMKRVSSTPRLRLRLSLPKPSPPQLPLQSSNGTSDHELQTKQPEQQRSQQEQQPQPSAPFPGTSTPDLTEDDFSTLPPSTLALSTPVDTTSAMEAVPTPCATTDNGRTGTTTTTTPNSVIVSESPHSIHNRDEEMEDVMMHHPCLEETERTALMITKREEDNSMTTPPFDMRKPPVMVEGYNADAFHMKDEEDNDSESEHEFMLENDHPSHHIPNNVPISKSYSSSSSSSDDSDSETDEEEFLMFAEHMLLGKHGHYRHHHNRKKTSASPPFPPCGIEAEEDSIHPHFPQNHKDNKNGNRVGANEQSEIKSLKRDKSQQCYVSKQQQGQQEDTGLKDRDGKFSKNNYAPSKDSKSVGVTKTDEEINEIVEKKRQERIASQQQKALLQKKQKTQLQHHRRNEVKHHVRKKQVKKKRKKKTKPVPRRTVWSDDESISETQSSSEEEESETDFSSGSSSESSVSSTTSESLFSADDDDDDELDDMVCSESSESSEDDVDSDEMFNSESSDDDDSDDDDSYFQRRKDFKKKKANHNLTPIRRGVVVPKGEKTHMRKNIEHSKSHHHHRRRKVGSSRFFKESKSFSKDIGTFQPSQRKGEKGTRAVPNFIKNGVPEAKPPTAEELRKILSEDNIHDASTQNWVRRSVRQPSRSVLHAKNVRTLVDKLHMNDDDMVVLKLKKYLNDPDTPCVVIDAALTALERNTNCEALYIQNFNQGMRDDQVLHLLSVLQRPECRIWCLNIGETYNVKSKTWSKFAKGLKKTNVTHMYASEHTISSELKDKIRDTIRVNRFKHNRHISPENLDVIIQCTHCWWNPINAKALRPYLQKKGYEHLLFDRVKQGLKGATTTADKDTI